MEIFLTLVPVAVSSSGRYNREAPVRCSIWMFSRCHWGNLVAPEKANMPTKARWSDDYLSHTLGSQCYLWLCPEETRYRPDNSQTRAKRPGRARQGSREEGNEVSPVIRARGTLTLCDELVTPSPCAALTCRWRSCQTWQGPGPFPGLARGREVALSLGPRVERWWVNEECRNLPARPPRAQCRSTVICRDRWDPSRACAVAEGQPRLETLGGSRAQKIFALFIRT